MSGKIGDNIIDIRKPTPILLEHAPNGAKVRFPHLEYALKKQTQLVTDMYRVTEDGCQRLVINEDGKGDWIHTDNAVEYDRCSRPYTPPTVRLSTLEPGNVFYLPTGETLYMVLNKKYHQFSNDCLVRYVNLRNGIVYDGEGSGFKSDRQVCKVKATIIGE